MEELTNSLTNHKRILVFFINGERSSLIPHEQIEDEAALLFLINGYRSFLILYHRSRSALILYKKIQKLSSYFLLTEKGALLFPINK